MKVDFEIRELVHAQISANGNKEQLSFGFASALKRAAAFLARLKTTYYLPLKIK